jgi:Tol biopolymer transport system component
MNPHINTDGSNQHHLGRQRHTAYQPVWSPNGRKIAYPSGGGSCNPTGFDPCNIYVINTDGSHQRQLTR